MGKILHENFGDQFPKCGYKLVPRFLIRFGSFFNQEARAINRDWGKKFTYDTKEAKDILQINFTPSEKTLIDMIPALIENGQIKPKPKKAKK